MSTETVATGYINFGNPIPAHTTDGFSTLHQITQTTKGHRRFPQPQLIADINETTDKITGIEPIEEGLMINRSGLHAQLSELINAYPDCRPHGSIVVMNEDAIITGDNDGIEGMSRYVLTTTDNGDAKLTVERPRVTWEPAGSSWLRV